VENESVAVGRRRSVSAHLANSHSFSQARNTGLFEDFSTASAHSQRTPSATPVLTFVVGMADRALDWCVLVA
jgi:hypothetical protein